LNFSHFKVPAGKRIKVADLPTDVDSDLKKSDATEKLEDDVRKLAELQSMLAAQDTYALLIILQAMDAAGKDGTVKHVLSGVNPSGCHVRSFKVPSNEELDHDYLWRYAKSIPERGIIGIFNRSHYEEVLVVRVHPEVLAREKMPRSKNSAKLWARRYEEINNFERYLVSNGIEILKFFLNISKEEQKRRFLERLDHPEKNWKFSEADVAERQYWDSYMTAYGEMLSETSTEHAPWYAIPADHKWFSRLAVADIVVRKLESMKLEFPTVEGEKKKALENARRMLEKEK
jgi:PPK2 family polyphosphate:nucleotide phosphotransferase